MTSHLQPPNHFRHSSPASTTSQARRSSVTSSMGSESPPAGFFSTFSVVDPNGTNGFENSAGIGGTTRAQKRNRRVFVCIPCHKRKLKCDKNLPCGRCVAYGAADECVYQALTSASTSPASSGPTTYAASRQEPALERRSSSRASSRGGTRDHPPRYAYRSIDGKCRATGITHWTVVASEFEEACPYLFGSDIQWQPRYRQLKNLKYFFTSLSGANFPFSNSSSYTPSKNEILNNLPPRNTVDALLGNYFMTFESTHRLLHPAQFQEEIEAFWTDRENTDDIFLAQLCVMLTLGCQSAPETLFEGTGRMASQWTELLLDGAQISLGRSPYMLMPTLATVRTLCMMTLCKMIGLRGTSSWQVSTMMGFVVRMATSMQLHRSATIFPGVPEFEAECRRRVWTTVQLLDLDVAMWAGTVPIARDHDNEPPLSINDSDIRQDPTSLGDSQGSASPGWVIDNLWAASEYTDGAFQSKLAEVIPLLSEVMATVNSISATSPRYGGVPGGFEHEKFMRLDKRIRSRLKEVEALLASGRGVSRSDRQGVLGGQLQFVRVLAHRTLLALHHAFARGYTSQTVRHEQSLRATLESSLALLNIQQHVAADTTLATLAVSTTMLDPSSAVRGRSRSTCSSPGLSPAILSAAGVPIHAGGDSRRWLLDLCRDDFSVAAAYVILALRRGDFDDCDGAASPDSAAAALRQSLVVVRARACRTLLHFKDFTGLSILAACLSYVKTDPRRFDASSQGAGLLPVMMQVAQDLEDVIVTGKSDVIWSSATAVHATSGVQMGSAMLHQQQTGHMLAQTTQPSPPMMSHHSHHVPHTAAPHQDPFGAMMGIGFMGSFP
ncbi:uncharacterized protein PgNI_04823 [Pyricularia grisea]|uniref:Zn(2)-C6 fungal-type domain-containing protein n=1 Tax=Pyricularia grisea TaxID=148305 RepID=A0A6P8BDI1_PYRGI|nr:uncharacterized protein PgNI_04823 [Pyricularia grisea]TLD13819.1 hypothetical protein PgNI_04823 [Pyricularia grisea]